MKFTIAIAALLAASAASAQTSIGVDSANLSQSSSGVFVEGSDVPHNTPSTSAPGSMHTAPCIVGSSFGLGVPGFGISGSNGRLEGNCNTREEAQFLYNVLSQPRGAARTAAIAHMCATDESLRRTLVGLGECVIAGSAQPTVSQRAPTTAVPLEVNCVRTERGIQPQVSQAVADAYTAAQIMRACR